MKPESKFWQQVKKNTPKIKWTRLESWASFGVPDLLGYHDSCGFFMVELKVAKGNKIHLSPHQIMFHTTMTKRNFILVKPAAPRFAILYKSSAIHELRTSLRDAKIAAQDDWTAIQEALIGVD
jgi:Holliday junction resolvase